MIVTIQCDHCDHDDTSCLSRSGIFVEKDLDCLFWPPVGLRCCVKLFMFSLLLENNMRMMEMRELERRGIHMTLRTKYISRTPSVIKIRVLKKKIDIQDRHDCREICISIAKRFFCSCYFNLATTVRR